VIGASASIISTIQILVLLLLVSSAVAVAAKRLRTPPAILLVLTGIVLALIPGLPRLQLAPEVALLVVLPPLIYSSSVAMSWREFRFNLRPISLLAVGCVLFTTVVVAAASRWLLGFSWPAGFVLGAIVSPPDPVAPLAIARRMQLPKRILVILEGEGLANDATALILFRFSVTAVSTGLFSFGPAVGTFVLILAGEILWGIGCGWLMLRLRRWVDDPRVEIMLSLLTPFLAYWPPVQLGGSGVLATVTAGLYISWNGLELIRPATRLQGIFFWDFLVYLIEGMVFLLTGLQARTLLAGLAGSSKSELALAAVVVSVAVIVTRFVWTFPATYLPRWLIPSLRRRDPAPPWQTAFVIGFTGVRGIVTLAAALAIPLATESGAPFPFRSRIIFLAFVVILVTLVGQGLMLPAVVRWLGLANAGRRERQAFRTEESRATRQALEAAIERLGQLAAEQQLPEDIVGPLRAYYRGRLTDVERRRDSNDHHRQLTELSDDITLRLIEAERQLINRLYREGKLDDDGRRHIEHTLDLRTANVAARRAQE
jgi:monovalent cation/hydrogen antiporter